MKELKFIKKVVDDHFEIDSGSKSQKTAYFLARSLAYCFGQEYTKASLGATGKVFGNRDHATVLHSRRRKDVYLASFPEFKEAMNKLRPKMELYFNGIDLPEAPSELNDYLDLRLTLDVYEKENKELKRKLAVYENPKLIKLLERLDEKGQNEAFERLEPFVIMYNNRVHYKHLTA